MSQTGKSKGPSKPGRGDTTRDSGHRRRDGKESNDLDKALDDTFPASDPPGTEPAPPEPPRPEKSDRDGGKHES